MWALGSWAEHLSKLKFLQTYAFQPERLASALKIIVFMQIFTEIIHRGRFYMIFHKMLFLCRFLQKLFTEDVFLKNVENP